MWFYYDLAGCGNQTKLLPHVCSQGWRWLATLYKGLGESCCWVIQQEYKLRIDGSNMKWPGWLAKLSKYALGLGHTDCHTWVVASLGFLTKQVRKLINPCARLSWWHQGHFGSCGSVASWEQLQAIGCDVWYVIMYCDMVTLYHCCMLE